MTRKHIADLRRRLDQAQRLLNSVRSELDAIEAAQRPPAQQSAPPIPPQPGTMWVPGFGFVSMDLLMGALGGK